MPALHVSEPIDADRIDADRIDAHRTAAGLTSRLDGPLWLLAPAPVGWRLDGTAYASDGRTTCATASAWSGPAPLGGPAELLLVSEEPGVGLGARYAGLDGIDAGSCVTGPPADHVEIDGHPVALWACGEAPVDRCVLVGEAAGGWLWLVLWPADAGALLAEGLLLADGRQRPVPRQTGPAPGRLLGP